MSDDESISDDEDLGEYYFMAIDDIEGDIQYALNELYNDSFVITRKNKQLKKMVESL